MSNIRYSFTKNGVLRLEITKVAKEELNRIFNKTPMDPDKSLRLAMAPVWEGEGDFGIVISSAGHADETVEYGGTKPLLIDPALASELSQAVLESHGTWFVFATVGTPS